MQRLSFLKKEKLKFQATFLMSSASIVKMNTTDGISSIRHKNITIVLCPHFKIFLQSQDVFDEFVLDNLITKKLVQIIRKRYPKE